MHQCHMQDAQAPRIDVPMSHRQSELEVAEETLRSAMLTGDVVELDELIEDNLLFIDPNGSVLSKQDDLALYRSGDQQLSTIDVHDQHIQLGRDVASVSVFAFFAGVYKGFSFQGHFRYLRVWHHTATGWRIVAGSVSMQNKP